MFIDTVSPRFCETDASGHINNTVLPIWFEKAREPIFRLFSPDLSPEGWGLILARIEVDFVAQIYYGQDLEIRTWLEKVGNSSMVVLQEVRLAEKVCARGRSVMVHFDFELQTSVTIPDEIRQQLNELVYQEPA